MKMFACALAAVAACLTAVQARAFDPISSVIGKGVATAMDARSKDEVKTDIEIDAAVTKKLAEQKGDDFSDISFLIFARHGVLVGFARSEEVKRKAGELAKGHKLLRSLKNDIVIGGASGSFGGNALLDKKIDLKLTATRGVSSVNMRWKVYGGDVFLTGVAQSKAEANLALKAVKSLEGVKTLHSSLRIGKT